MLRITHLRISTSLYLLFGLAALVMSCQSLVGVFRAWTQVGEGRVEQLASANQQLFAALQYIRQERGPSRVALEAKGTTDPKLVEQQQAARAKATPALTALLATCERITCAAASEIAAIRAAINKVVAVRREVDPAFKQTLAERRPGIAKDWNDASTALVEALEKVSLALTDQVRMVDPETAELVAIKEAAYLVRDAVGLERTFVQGAMAAKTITVDVKARMSEFRGQAGGAWRMLRIFSARRGVPTPVVAAIEPDGKRARLLHPEARRDREGGGRGARAADVRHRAGQRLQHGAQRDRGHLQPPRSTPSLRTPRTARRAHGPTFCSTPACSPARCCWAAAAWCSRRGASRGRSG